MVKGKNGDQAADGAGNRAGNGEPAELQRLRRRIDALDGQLLALICERAELAAHVARVKREAPGDGNANCYRPERETRVLRRVVAENPGPLAPERVAALFREIMSACLSLQQELRVAYLGPEGTYTYAAARKHFGHAAGVVSCAGIDQVFREVEVDACQFGVAPVENSSEGAVGYTLDLLTRSPLKVCGEVELRIHHCLLAAGGALEEVRQVCAHDQALAQCRRWLDARLPGAGRVPVASSAEAVQRAAAEPGTAALAGEEAGEPYRLRVLARRVEDEPDNTTRFLVLGREAVPPSGDDKTSLLFATHNRPGALYRALGCFAAHQVSMARIESRPSRRGMWDYVFFVDLEGHMEESAVRAALEKLRERSVMCKWLGSYPRAAP